MSSDGGGEPHQHQPVSGVCKGCDKGACLGCIWCVWRVVFCLWMVTHWTEE